jgi:hypothetical protein
VRRQRIVWSDSRRPRTGRTLVNGARLAHIIFVVLPLISGPVLLACCKLKKLYYRHAEKSSTPY